MINYRKRVSVPVTAAGWLLAALLLAGCQPAAPTPPPAVAAPAASATPRPEEPTNPPPTARPSPTPPPEPVVARIALQNMPQTLDPARVAPLDASGSDLAHNLFVTLARLDAASGAVEPGLAVRWERLEDGRVWNVYLRDDVPWVRFDAAAGEVTQVRAVTAGDVVAAAHRACRADSGVPLGTRPALFLIQGCREVYETDPARLADEDVARLIGVRVLNDVAVEFRLTIDSAVFPTLLASLPLAPTPPEQPANAEGLLTSGPYALAAWQEDGYRLVANPHWPLERAGNVTIVEAGVSDGTLNGWQSGEVDLAAVPGSALGALPADDPAYHLLAEPVVMFAAAAYEVPPLDNAGVRRALALSVDRAALAQDDLLLDLEGPRLPARSLVPAGTAPGTASLDAVVYDPEAARVALAQAGYDGCRGLPTITLLTVDTVAGRTFAERLSGMWAEVLGCEGAFAIEVAPAFDVVTALQGPAQGRGMRAGVILAGWQGDYPDAHHYLADVLACREQFPAAFLDLARPCLPAEEVLTEAAAEHDPAVRASLYDDLNAAFFGPGGEFPVIPLTVRARAVAVSPWLAIGDAPAGPLRFDAWVIDAVEQPDAPAR